jgi:hypothetical protein
MGAAQQNAVPAREHVEIVLGQQRIIDLGLRLQDGQLPFHRREFAVAEQLACTQAGTVDDDRLRKRRDVGRRRKRPNVHTPAGISEVTQQRRKIDRRLDEHHGVDEHVPLPERVFRWTEPARFREQIA